jgi:hypothetical protein
MRKVLDAQARARRRRARHVHLEAEPREPAARPLPGAARPGRLQAQVAAAQPHGGETVDEYLFGDDAEQDAFIYSLYADILSGRSTPCAWPRSSPPARSTATTSTRSWPYHGQLAGSGDVVRRIFIHLDRRSPLDRFAAYGARVVAIYNYFQVAVLLFDAGLLSARGLVGVLAAMAAAGYTPERVANSVQDLMRRGFVQPPAIAQAHRGPRRGRADRRSARGAARAVLHAEVRGGRRRPQHLERSPPPWELRSTTSASTTRPASADSSIAWLGIRLLD